MERSVDKICMSLPAREEMTDIIRMATTAIANRAGFDLDESDDINTAMEEVFRYFCSGRRVAGDDVMLNFSLNKDKLEIKAGEALTSLVENDTRIGRYCRFILEKVTDSYRELADEGKYSIVIEKTPNS